jgi:2,3,4,5-tetrahydropyridine-2,6-dicarboxylate N-succinyltransferase
MQKLKKIIEKSWEGRDKINTSTKGEARKAVSEVLNLLDSGKLRVAEKATKGTKKGQWIINDWAKKAILLSFRLNDNMLMDSGLEVGKSEATWYDKVPSKFMGWKEKEFKAAGFRAVPGCIVRKSAFIGKGVVLLPSFVNLGAYVDEGTMIDTWATVGSCAQIGKNCHISGGAGIGGVLEPLQANPVIIEDNCFIGARAEIAEGVIVGTGSVISMGVYIGASTRIVDRETGEVFYGKVPPYSVVVAGSMPGNTKPKTKGKKGAAVPNLYCVVIVKKVDEKTRSKTSINELLRD